MEFQKYEFPCEECEHKAANMDGLKKHTNSKHSNKNKLIKEKIKILMKKTHQKKILQKTIQHRKIHQKKKIDYQCDECDYKVNNMDDLKKHTNSKHTKENKLTIEK